jgi:hypothetical protein
LDWDDRIFRYCERGNDAGFWAEPLNAVTNGAFLIAAVLAAIALLRLPSKPGRIAEWVLVVLLVAIGLGSFLFHTHATRWAAVADTAPIGLFMVAYLTYALRRFLELHWAVIAAVLLLFAGALRAAGSVTCETGLLPLTESMGAPCLNGTAGYLPAFIALLIVGTVLALRRHPACRSLLAAAAMLFVSMLARTLDWELCRSVTWGGRDIGTHFLWHLLNAALLYVLLLAAIRHGAARR